MLFLDVLKEGKIGNVVSAVVLRDELFPMFAVAACGLCSWEWFLKWEWGGMWTGGGRGRGVQRQRWWPPTEAALAARHGRREPTKPPSETGQLGTARKAAGSSRVLRAGVVGGGAAPNRRASRLPLGMNS